jgi:hypothetical protein
VSADKTPTPIDSLQSDDKRRVIHGPTILLSNGAYFDFLNPGGSQWGAREISIALSKVCRFAGHCSGFYSVAEHSVLVAKLVPPEHRLAALLHDAHEAFTGDLTYPLKRLLGQLVRDIEDRIDAELFARFGVALPLDPCIKEADRWMLHIEQRRLMTNHDEWPAAAPPPWWAEEAIKIERLAPEDAARRWYCAFNHEMGLREKRHG